MSTLRSYKTHLIYLTVSFVLVSTITQAQDSLTDNDGTLQPVSGSHLVRFADNALTVKVEDISLQKLLDEICRKSGLTMVRYVALDERMTLEFHRLSLDEGLRRILRNRSFVLAYVRQTPEERRSAVARRLTLWVLPQGEENISAKKTIVKDTTATARTADKAFAAGISWLQTALSSEAAEDREEAVLALGDSGHAEALAALTLALSDENEEVREAAIVALAEIGGADATHALAIALGDEDPEIRSEAIDALGEIGGEFAIGLLEQALADHKNAVRKAAAEKLDQLRNQFH